MSRIELLFNKNRLVVKNLIQTQSFSPIFVGRWTISGVSNSTDNINKIIDRNNEDHCGVCYENITLSEPEKKKDADYFTPFII